MKDVVARLRSGGVVFFIASAMVNVFNFAFQVVVSRALGPSDYSALGALLALLLITAVPLSALQLACAQAQAASVDALGLGRVLRRTSCLAIVLLTGFLVGAPVFDGALHLHGLALPTLVGCCVALATVATVPQGALIGALRFRQVAIATFVGAGLSRLVLGILVSVSDAGVEGAMGACLLAQLITLVLLLIPVRHRLGASGPQLAPSPSDGFLSVGALTGLAALTSIDTVVARNTLSSPVAGQYVAAATAGRITLFLPSAIALLAFPSFSKAAARGESCARLLVRSAAAVGGLGLAGAAVLAIAPALTIRLLFGGGYRGAQHPLPILALGGVLLGLLSLFSYYHIAHRSWASVLGWLGTALIGIGVEVRSTIDPHALALTMLGVTGSCLLLSLSVALLPRPSLSAEPVHVPALDVESGSPIPASGTYATEVKG